MSFSMMFDILKKKEKNTCKIGIPVDSLEKYLIKLNKLKYAYAVYDYSKLKAELHKKYFSEGN